jgi:hypothetical protein
MVDAIAEHFKSNCGFELGDCAPWFLRANRKSRWYRVPNTLGKICSHLYGSAMTTILPACGEELRKIEVDWLRVKPVVKVVGEFWAQMTESDGNFRMLEFLEKEGAEVSIEPISSWVLYLLHQMKARLAYRRKMEAYSSPWTAPRKAIASRASSLSKRLGYTLGGKIYLHHFHRLAKLLGVPDQTFASQRALSEMAEPYYNTLLRGGEGHLEVAKTLYYARHKVCHLVLALKPFGCLPSVQSDAVQASLVERFPEVSFLPIETSADGEIQPIAVSRWRCRRLGQKPRWSLSEFSSPRIIHSKTSAALSRSTRLCVTLCIRFHVIPASSPPPPTFFCMWISSWPCALHRVPVRIRSESME